MVDWLNSFWCKLFPLQWFYFLTFIYIVYVWDLDEFDVDFVCLWYVCIEKWNWVIKRQLLWNYILFSCIFHHFIIVAVCVLCMWIKKGYSHRKIIVDWVDMRCEGKKIHKMGHVWQAISWLSIMCLLLSKIVCVCVPFFCFFLNNNAL